MKNKLIAAVSILVLSVATYFAFNGQIIKNSDIDNAAYTCTLSVSCEVLLDNIDKLDVEKHELVPSDGLLLAPIAVSFHSQESVFDILQRTLQENKIHFEFTETPLYETSYIEGIGNIYEFDAGELSGWMYCINGDFPTNGFSMYQPADGDVIQILYTCDLGRDIGNKYLIGD